MDIESNTAADNISSSRPSHFNDRALTSPDFKANDKQCSTFAWRSNSLYGRHWYSLFPQVNIATWFINSVLGRDIICFINRRLFNPTRFNDHLFKMNIVSRPLYKCGVLESPDHILFVCPNDATSIRHSTLSNLCICRLRDRSGFDISLNLAA